MTTQEFLSLLRGIKKNGNGWMALCPLHNDKQNSLSVSEGNNGRVVIHCHAGCSFEAICMALNVDAKELTGNGLKASQSTLTSHTNQRQKHIVDVHDYKDENGALLYQNVRFEPKSFQQRKPNGQGGFDYSLNGVRRVPYRLPELIESLKNKPSQTVFLAEGEKDCDNLRAQGLTASSFKNWKEEFNQFIQGADVVLLYDHDASGIKQANNAATIICNVVKSLKVVDLYESEPLPDKHGKDVSDFLEAGNAKHDLLSIVETTPTWKPSEDTSEIKKDDSPLRVVCLADVIAMVVSWLWFPYIPLGKLTLLDGEEGIGKSWLLCAIAGRISQGERLPLADEAVKGNVLLLSGSEDGLADTIKPRLVSVGADCTRIFAVDEPFSFDEEGLIRLAALIAEYKPSLVIIDPLFDYVTAKTDINKDNQSRAVTKPLREMAERFGCAIVAVRHIGKSKGNGEARAAGLGGIGFRAAGRSGLLVGCDPQDRSKRAMVLTKSNLADVNAAKAVGFTIKDGQFYWQESNLTAERILSKLESEDEREEQNEAVSFLREALRDGKKLAQDIKREGAKIGLSEKRLRTAQKRLDVQIEREGFGPGSKSYWSLPSILAHENTIDAIHAHENNMGMYGKYGETRASMEKASEESEVSDYEFF